MKLTCRPFISHSPSQMLQSTPVDRSFSAPVYLLYFIYLSYIPDVKRHGVIVTSTHFPAKYVHSFMCFSTLELIRRETYQPCNEKKSLIRAETKMSCSSFPPALPKSHLNLAWSPENKSHSWLNISNCELMSTLLQICFKHCLVAVLANFPIPRKLILS